MLPRPQASQHLTIASHVGQFLVQIFRAKSSELLVPDGAWKQKPLRVCVGTAFETVKRVRLWLCPRAVASCRSRVLLTVWVFCWWSSRSPRGMASFHTAKGQPGGHTLAFSSAGDLDSMGMHPCGLGCNFRRVLQASLRQPPCTLLGPTPGTC